MSGISDAAPKTGQDRDQDQGHNTVDAHPFNWTNEFNASFLPLTAKKSRSRPFAQGSGSIGGTSSTPQKPPRFVKRQVPALEEECYPTDHAQRGVCLILDNYEFKKGLGLAKRKGSKVDRRAAKKTFKELEFKVIKIRNVTYMELQKILERVAGMDHSQSDCFALVMMSHGSDGFIWTKDVPIPVQYLWEAFDAKNAPTLVGKPKLLFLQSCQGGLSDPGVTRPMESESEATQTDFMASYKVPTHSDFLIAHSSIIGHSSFRHTEEGSWYIQSLVSMLREHAEKRDLVTILTMTIKKVATEYQSKGKDEEESAKKQTPFFYSTLTHKIFLDKKEKSNTY